MNKYPFTGEKSNITSPLIWLIFLCLTAFLCSLNICDNSLWVKIVIMLFIVVLVIFYMVVYWYCLKNDPDLLRTEKFVISKYAIDNQKEGDSLTGESDKNVFGAGALSSFNLTKKSKSDPNLKEDKNK